MNSHFELLKNKNFSPKIELLRCINKLINKLKHEYSPYAKKLLNDIYTTFDKALSFSGIDLKINRDADLKKYLLDILYSLLLYTKENITEYLDKILSSAKINKININKEIRSISLKIINIITSKDIQSLYNTNKISNNTNYNYNTNIYINNYLTNDNNNNRYKERPLSFKSFRGRESTIKRMIEEDKKKFGDKKHNKGFVFVSQSPKKEGRNTCNSAHRKENNNINKTNNINVLKLKVNEIDNMNNTMINTVSNIENYLNNNFNSMELKLNQIEKIEDEFSDKKNLLDEKISNIILNDRELINFMEEIDEKDINNISMKNYEEIINRFMILILVNKKNKDLFEKYLRLINKLLNCKKIKFVEEETKENNNYHKYKISYNLENNLKYLFKSLNI